MRTCRNTEGSADASSDPPPPAGNFRYFETYNVVALIYLTMTIGLSLKLRRLESRLRGTG